MSKIQKLNEETLKNKYKDSRWSIIGNSTKNGKKINLQIKQAGFSVVGGATFLAEIAPCTSIDLTNEAMDNSSTFIFEETTSQVTYQYNSTYIDNTNKLKLTLFNQKSTNFHLK